MRKWEDIVKDKLGGYESNLPEDSLAAFNARRATAGSTKAKRFPLVWAIVPALAAGLAAVLLLRKPTVPENGIQIIPQPVETYSQVDDSLDTATPPATEPLIAQAVRTKAVRPMPKAEQPEKPEATTVAEETRIPEETLIPETDDIGPEDTPEEPATDNRPVVQDSSPFVPQPSTEKSAVQLNIGTEGAIAAGGGLLAALATQLARADVSALIPGNHAIDGPGSPNSNAIDGPNSTNCLETTHSHRMPLVVGLSVKFPVTEKIGVTTGLEYSLYSSSFSYPPGEKTQLVHYMGIPVRLDWTFVSGRWVDAYLGAGVKGDLCLGATLGGEAIGKDGPAFRLLGAGGIQFNATRNFSFFLETEICWTLPSERRVLSTYSSEHPWMFTVATGVRINLGK
ncbi:MAG: hypothetical protein II421_04160 [Bacteroidales bacterium]|nr:hypothetical protein [Bacteroidales bacterium]